MLNADQISALRDAAGHIADPITEYLLRDIARRVSEAGQLTSTAAYQTWRAQQLGMSQKEIKKALQKLLKKSAEEIDRLMTQTAKVGYDFDVQRLPTAAAIPFDDNLSIQKVVRAAVELAQEDFTNLTKTIGMVDRSGVALPLQKAYRAAMGDAFEQVFTGAADYNTAIRKATANLATFGLRVVDYESNIHRSIEAATRGCIMGGLGLMDERIAQIEHDQLGCDGWEISAHANSAPDHEPIQGRQYSDDAYQNLNNSLQRRIGTLNCGHVAFPIILGVSKPQYTPEELEKFRQDNAEGFTYGGKHYTGYEATQHQRKLERRMRAQKNRIIMDEAAGDAEKLQQDQIKLQITRQEYARFSKAAGLRTEPERAYVTGFGRKRKIKKLSTATTSSHSSLKPVVTNTPPEAPHNPVYGCNDVTEEWIKNATPRSHEIQDVHSFQQDGVVYTVGADGKDVKLEVGPKERKAAEVLRNVLGGSIQMMPKVQGKYTGIQTPDLLFRGDRWDVKTPEKANKNVIFNAIHKKRMQADNFIIDISVNGMSEQEAIRQIEEIFQKPYTAFVHRIILIKDDGILRIVERK